jgi:hypothetical protein
MSSATAPFALGEAPRRPTHYPLAAPDVARWRANYWLSPDTPPALHAFLLNLHGLLLDPSAQLPASEDYLQDTGLLRTGFSNAAGGSWSGLYRQFQVRHNGIPHTISVGILAREPGSTGGKTTLLVGCSSSATPAHLSLQLALDQFTEVAGEHYTIWHDGRLTNGQRGAAPRQAVLDYIAHQAPDLVQANRVVLGRLSNAAPLTWEQSPTRAFLHNLARYALLRDDFRHQAQE